MGLFLVNTLNNPIPFAILTASNLKTQITMEGWYISKDKIKEFCFKNLATHTDWTGTRVETKHKCESVEAFVNKLMEWIEDNHYSC